MAMLCISRSHVVTTSTCGTCDAAGGYHPAQHSKPSVFLPPSLPPPPYENEWLPGERRDWSSSTTISVCSHQYPQEETWRASGKWGLILARADPTDTAPTRRSSPQPPLLLVLMGRDGPKTRLPRDHSNPHSSSPFGGRPAGQALPPLSVHP